MMTRGGMMMRRWGDDDERKGRSGREKEGGKMKWTGSRRTVRGSARYMEGCLQPGDGQSTLTYPYCYGQLVSWSALSMTTGSKF